LGDRKRRFALGAVALPLLFLVMSGLARAASFAVDNTNDSGLGSLRAAITSANGIPGANTIDFSVTGTIALLSTLPAITGNLTIIGPTGSPGITIDGGGAVQLMRVNTGATVNLQFLTLTNGFATKASGVDGGGILNNGTLTISNCTLSGNITSFGGAIFSSSTLTVTDSTFSGNRAGSGGGIFSGGLLTITSSTFSGNFASGFGGAIFNFAVGNLDVTNSTFSSNDAGVGGAINDSGSSLAVKSTILSASGGGNCGGNVALTDVGYNISDDNSCGFSGTSINNSIALHLDPAGLADNGGPTQTIALELDSDAVDFIPVANCTDQSSPTPLPLTTDQRGLPRPDFGNSGFCDAGAYELQTPPVFVIAPNSERLQIVHASNPAADEINTAFTFTENGTPTCDAAHDAFNGVTVAIFSGSCADPGNFGLTVLLEDFSVHTVNHHSYGTIFISQPPVTVSGKMVALTTPPAPACGQWTLNLQVTGFDTTNSGSGPFALILANSHGDQGCFDITNAIVGNQIPHQSVRCGTR
jgi:predicted outer membrane repeat protein